MRFLAVILIIQRIIKKVIVLYTLFFDKILDLKKKHFWDMWIRKLPKGILMKAKLILLNLSKKKKVNGGVRMVRLRLRNIKYSTD